MIIKVELKSLRSNPWQTRKTGDEAYIKTLALDIAEHGLLQYPVGRLVNEDGKPADFDIDEITPEVWGDDPGSWQVQLAFGHNRLAAYHWLNEIQPQSNLGGDWTRMPVEIRHLSDEQMAVLAWSENEKRREHTPVERALAIQARIQDFGWTHEEAAERLGISRPAVSNALRLLKLPEALQDDLQEGRISERAGMALIPLYEIDEQVVADTDFEFTRQAILGWAREGWSSVKLRERVNEALGWLKKEMQPELAPPQTPPKIQEQDLGRGNDERELERKESTPPPAPPKIQEHEIGRGEAAQIQERDLGRGEAAQIEKQDLDREAQTYENSVVTWTITLDPVKNGQRQAIVGLRANNHTPLMRVTNEEAIYIAYSELMTEMVEELKAKLEGSNG